LGAVFSIRLARFGFAAAGFFPPRILELATRPGKDESRTKDDAHGFGKRRLASD
jgi:hypothetical protein